MGSEELSTIRITAAICTRNRCDLLPTAVRSVAQQSFASDRFEILIVDNDSTDGTQGAAVALGREFDNVRYCIEPQVGLGYARNKAIAEARGELLAYIDDDAEMLPGYLAALDRLYRDEERVGAAGGPIEIAWLGPVPDWYEPGLDGWFNRLDLASYRMELKYPRIIYGTNMTFPVSLLKELGGFQTVSGIVDSSVTAIADDEEIILKLHTHGGYRVIWEPSLRVRHCIQPERLTPDYFLKKSQMTGIARCRIEHRYPGYGGVSRALAGLAEWGARKLTGRGRGKLTDAAQFACSWGYLKEWWKAK